MPLLDADDRNRLTYELDLRQRGLVPLTAFDASCRRLHKALPPCCVRQVVRNKQPHGRVIWSHPGPSGLDPRAIGPLSLTRVADGAGGDPLDEPMTLGEAVRWLLTSDVRAWLARPRHRALEQVCLHEWRRSRWSCLTHRVADPVAQDVATALGDISFRDCSPRTDRTVPRWSTLRTQPYDLAGRAVSALDATRRLSRWYVDGVEGRDAWELTLNDVAPKDLRLWHRAGFTTEETAAWSGRGRLDECLRWRETGVAPYAPLALPPGAIQSSRDRGIHWYAQFQLARRGRSGELVVCPYCCSKDTQQPCRSCRAEGRAAPPGSEWQAYTAMAQVHPAYAEVDTGPAVACGVGNCQGSLALSAADGGVRL